MMKILLNITLILVTFFACYLEEIYLLFRPPQQQQPLTITIRAQQSFIYDQEKALSAKRKKARSNYIPVFTFSPQRIEESKKRLASLKNEFLLYKAVKGRGAGSLATYLKAQFGIRLSQPEVNRLLKYRDLSNLLKGILTIQESTLQSKILESALYIKGKKTIEVHTPGTNETAIYAVENITTLEEARFSMQAKIRQLFWQVDKRVLDPLIQIAIVTIVPNLAYDHIRNENRLEHLNQQFPSKIIEFEPGDVVVSFKRVLQDEDVRLLTDYQKQLESRTLREAAWILFSILFLVVFYNLFISRILVGQSRSVPPRHILLSLMILHTFILKACLIFTPFPIYVLPFSLLPLLVISLNHGRITAIATTIVAAILVSLFCGRTFDIMLYFLFGGLTAALVAAHVRKRLLILVPSLLVGVINVISVTGMAMDWQAALAYIGSLQSFGLDTLGSLLTTAPTKNIIWAFSGGLAAGPLALILLPVLEVSWQTASSFKLNRYTDLQHPTMKKLLNEARGTYQHAMTVAYLAQSAGEAIGANTLLLRIGAYYHDIGKMDTPGYFIENQFNGENPHDNLEPQESANIIVDHVRHGLKIGQNIGLPKVVVDLILQHHGTHLIEYFYTLATKTMPKPSVREDDYRYPGPKPQSIEAAILMIADAAEAASRALKEPNRKNLEKMIRLVLVKRIVDGQFSECELTTRDLNKIVQALVDSLEASFHSRIKYPWQQNVVTPKKGTWRINKANAGDRKHRSFKL
jgi:putative nucleotidyltransferase with HDIG domain